MIHEKKNITILPHQFTVISLQCLSLSVLMGGSSHSLSRAWVGDVQEIPESHGPQILARICTSSSIRVSRTWLEGWAPSSHPPLPMRASPRTEKGADNNQSWMTLACSEWLTGMGKTYYTILSLWDLRQNWHRQSPALISCCMYINKSIQRTEKEHQACWLFFF